MTTSRTCNINDVANDQLVQFRLARVRITRQHRAMTILPDRILLQLRRAQDFEIDRVVEIVTVISDLVRQVRDLRFERRTAIFSSPGAGGS